VEQNHGRGNERDLTSLQRAHEVPPDVVGEIGTQTLGESGSAILTEVTLTGPVRRQHLIVGAALGHREEGHVGRISPGAPCRPCDSGFDLA
jgi:hypothetical protein